MSLPAAPQASTRPGDPPGTPPGRPGGGASPAAALRLALPLLLGWMPAWALFALLMSVVHAMPLLDAALHAGRLVALAALLGLLVLRAVRRWPWPYPWRWRFLLGHLLAAPLFSLAWLTTNSVLASLWQGRLVLVVGPGFTPFFVTGIWLYAMVTGVAYAQQAARLNAQAQALAATARLAALRAQLHPHFLFNALHTVVQLIPMDPRAATRAAEELAALLRMLLDRDTDTVTLREEWALVQRSLALEQLRLGDRLVLQATLAPAALDAELPSFALQTLVENALRHGAEPRVQPTRLTVRAAMQGTRLVLEVHDDGAGCALVDGWPEVKRPAAPGIEGLTGPTGPSGTAAGTRIGPGTGLQRLRERLAHLYPGNDATLQLASYPGQGLRATLHVPQDAAGADERHPGGEAGHG